MVKSALGGNQPSVYQLGEKVLVKCDGKDAGVRRYKQRVVQQATITGARKKHTYRAYLENGMILTVNVGKLTSTTRMEEKERQSAARVEQCERSTTDQDKCTVIPPRHPKEEPPEKK